MRWAGTSGTGNIKDVEWEGCRSARDRRMSSELSHKLNFIKITKTSAGRLERSITGSKWHKGEALQRPKHYWRYSATPC